MLALIDHKVLVDEMHCKVAQESDTVTKVEFKLRLHTFGKDRTYFANKFDPVLQFRFADKASYYLSFLLDQLMREDSGVESVEAKPFILRVHHTALVSMDEIKERIENAAQKMKLDLADKAAG